MPSPLFVSFSERIKTLKASLIAEQKENYQNYTASDHHSALGFRLLASAHLEEYVESRCENAAAACLEAHKQGKRTRASMCLLIWHSTYRVSKPIPLEPSDFDDRDEVDAARAKYSRLVRGIHGIDGSKLRELVIPLGLRDTDLDQGMLDQLNIVAGERNRAAHISVNRAKLQREPIEEWKILNQLMQHLIKLDIAIDRVISDRL